MSSRSDEDSDSSTCELINESREKAYTAVILLALGASVASLSVLSIALPIITNFSKQADQNIVSQLAFCERSSSDLVQASFQTRFALRGNETELNVTYNRTRRDLLDAARGLPELMEHNHAPGHECKCEYPSGPPGLPGRDGLRGAPGSRGSRGEPARLPCDPPIDYKKMCPDPCPRGVQGPVGERGEVGEKGEPGAPGRPGKRGEDGETGPKGAVGPQGVPGLDGDIGDPGEDAIPSPFIPGPPGEMGDEGPQGPPGPRGMPGIDGPDGPQGPRGPKGEDGFPGAKGDSGQEGPMGEAGDEGEKGVCPTYCATDGGVFFVQPPDWFFKDQE